MSIHLLLEEPQGEKPERITKSVIEQVGIIISTYKQAKPEIPEIEIDLLDIPNGLIGRYQDRQKLGTIFFEIKKNGQVGEQAFNVFILSSYALPVDELNKGLIIQGQIILASSALTKLEGYNKVIKRALDACRLLFTDNFCENLRQKVPNFTLDHANLIKELITLKNKKPYGSHHLIPIIALLKHYQKRAPRYYPKNVKRKTSSSSPRTRPDYTIIEPSFSNDSDEVTVREFHCTPTEIDDDGFNIDAQEYLADQKSSKRYLAVNLIAPDEVQHSLSLQNQLAKASANHIFRREKQLACEYRQLTSYDVYCLVEHCMSFINVADDYTYLLTSLFTGRDLKQIKYNNECLIIGREAPFKGVPVWLHKPNLPEHKVDPPLETLLNRADGKVIMSLPQQFSQTLTKLSTSSFDFIQTQESARHIIETINNNKNTRLTLSRITNYLSYYLSNQGVDSTEIALLLDKNIQQEPGCSYYQVNVGYLLELHQKFVKDLLSCAKYQLPKEIKQSTVKTVGSQLQIKPEILSKMFSLLQKRLSLLRNGEWNALEEFHNLYTIYILNLLNISTGHRPVRHPYETVDCFDLNAGTIFISDKEVRSALSARVIVLPKIAIEQITYYLEHLNNIQSYISNVNIESGQKIKSALVAKGPLFFFLNDLIFTAVIPSNLDAYSSDILPLKLNWHRHFMRTWLRKQNIHGHLVDGWMGHLSSGGDALGKYSGIGRADLTYIAITINELMITELKIKAAKPWRCL